MKQCPKCQKEFPDTMRFCQSDGTPLVDKVEESQPEDPLKTTVVRQEDIASSIPPADPFKTMVASSLEEKEEEEDVLQLPEEIDPMKTMVAQPIVEQEKPILDDFGQNAPKFESIKEEIKAETPSSPFGGFSAPNEPLPEPPKDISNEPTELQPQPPKFNEPDLMPPSFGDMSAKEEKPVEDIPATVFQKPWEAGSAPKADETPFSNESPFSKPDTPIPSPFDDKPKATFEPTPVNEEPMFGSGQQPPTSEPPQSPFGQQPLSPFDAPKSPFDAPQQTPFGGQQPSSFEPPKPAFQEPPVQFGSPQAPFNQMNEPSFNQPLQQTEWMPPSAPVAGWQDQGLGAETPFQPPRAMSGQNQTLAIVSLACGGASLLMLVGSIVPFVGLFCGILSLGLGVAAIITGFLARGRANNHPEQYGGGGLALGGIITGALSILAIVGLFILAIVFLGMANF